MKKLVAALITLFPQNPPIPKWKYRIETYVGTPDDEIEVGANIFGAGEWELVAIISFDGPPPGQKWFFKKPYYS